MAATRRALCGAADIKSWSKRLVPEQIHAQHSLLTVIQSACREAGLPETIAQVNGDGVLIMAPSGIDETEVVPNLIRGLRTALFQQNRILNDAARIRLRFALTTGLVTPGPAGFGGKVIDCFRLLDSGPVRQALDDFPEAQLALVVSDQLYQEVVRQNYGDLRADDFWRVDCSIPEKEFSGIAWLTVSDRTGGPPTPRQVDPQPPALLDDLPEEIGQARARCDAHQYRSALKLLNGLPEGDPAELLAVLDVRADCLMGLREYEAAVQELERLLRVCENPAVPPGPDALLRLGRCNALRGRAEVARHDWKYLTERVQPLHAAAYLELGRLEGTEGRHATAQAYLLEGLRIVRAHPDTWGGLLDEFIAELSELPAEDR